jgi:DNA-binding XRE family transcriptional regulator
MPIYRDDKFRGRQAELDWTVEEVARRAEVSEKTVIAIRKGRRVSATSLEKVATAMKLPMTSVYEPRDAATV